MKYLPIDNQLFTANRKRLRNLLPHGALAVFNANDIMPTNADGTMPFKQNSDLFYFSGVDQEETILVVFPTAVNPAHREILFVRETNEEIAIWEGEKLTKEKATEVSGIKTVYWTSQFEQIFHSLMQQAESVYLNKNEHARAASPVETRDDRFRKWCMEKYPLHQYLLLHP